MNKKDLRQLLVSNFKPVADVNFADTASATRNALIEYYGLQGLNSRELRANKGLVMALVEEVIDEILPEKLNNRLERFAEVKSYARDEEVIFEIKNKGKRRAYLTIQKGAKGGMYKAARLDSTQMTLNTWIETVGVYVTLEEILLGKYTLRDLMNNILEGFEERIYVQVIEALQSAGGNAPSANVTSSTSMNLESLDSIIRVISSYGSPMIVGPKSRLGEITNQASFADATPNTPVEDLNDVRNQGFVGLYKGTPVVELQNYIVNEETNAEWLLNEDYLFILPASARPVKVALKGDLMIREITHATGSMEQNAEKMLGVGLLLTNNIGVYDFTGN